MFKNFYEYLYLKAFISIVISNSKTVVYVEMLNSKGSVSSSEESFSTKYLSTEMYEYILDFTKETPFYYVSILDNSLYQGVIPSCEKNKLAYFYDVSSSEYKCHNNKWSYYTAKNDVYEIEKVYEKIGVDFIFSPFVVLSNFFKDKIDNHLAMFLLIEENSISLSVFNNSELLFGEYIDMSAEVEPEELSIDDETIEDMDIIDEEVSIDLDDIDSIDELDDFSDIADLDSIDDLDEFDETKDIEEELAESEEKEEFPVEDSDGLNEDYQRFVLIQSAINEFYKNEKFNSEFIENTYIADSVGVSSDMKKYLEEEMFLNVYVRHIELATEVCEIAKMELS